MKNFLMIMLLCLPTLAWMQIPGLYGRKVSLEISGMGQYNFFENNVNGFSQYQVNGDRLVNESKKFNFAYAAEINIQAKNRFSIGLEYSKYFADATYEYWVTDFSGYTNVFPSENIDFETTTLMPKIELFHKGTNAPVGMSHQIGFGFANSAIVQKSYAYRVNFGEGTIDGLYDDFLNSKTKFKGYSLQYALNLRKALSKRLLFSTSVRYSLNFGGKSSSNRAEASIARARLYSPVMFKMGLAFMLF